MGSQRKDSGSQRKDSGSQRKGFATAGTSHRRRPGLLSIHSPRAAQVYSLFSIFVAE
jgi:hypothetical protein